ncbi:MAG: hypothetical protein ACM3SV_03590 [Betaproteobacteria bacterium]
MTFLRTAHAALHLDTEDAMWALFDEWANEASGLLEACTTARAEALYGLADACIESALACH